MNLSPDSVIVGSVLGYPVSMTLVGAWIVIAPLVLFCRLATRRFTPGFKMTRTQNMLESLVVFIRDQIEGVLGRPADKYLPLIGSLLIFILAANWSMLLPIPFETPGGVEWFAPTTSSLSTTAALALVVMASTFWFGIKARGAKNYFGKYLKPVFLMLPLNIISEISSSFALAMRLYGNIMSMVVLYVIILALSPLLFPAILNIFGLLAGTIQPYIFAILALVYIGSAMGEPTERERRELVQLKQRRI